MTTADTRETEALSTRWRRRALTLTVVAVLATVYLTLLPLVLLGAALRDLGSARRGATLRLALFGAVYLVAQVVGVVGAAGIWLLTAGGGGGRRPRFLAWNRTLQKLWAGSLLWAVRRIFSLRLVVDDAGLLREGPALVFVRHASLADTLLPAALISGRTGMRLRYVLKSELLWDPCLDIVGNRLPNVFVRRGSGEAEREVAAIEALAADLADDEGVLIYPEGTRFTPERRQRALDRIAATGDAKRLESARALRHLLPPRTGGPRALFAAAPDTDVLLMGHAGFDGLAKVADILSGGLVGQTIHVRFWRIPGSSIPRDRAQQVAWLDARWAEIDDWLESLAPTGTAA